MNDEELLTALMRWLNEIVGGDPMIVVDLLQLQAEFAEVESEQLHRVVGAARKRGFIAVLTGFVQITEAGVEFAQQP